MISTFRMTFGELEQVSHSFLSQPPVLHFNPSLTGLNVYGVGGSEKTLHCLSPSKSPQQLSASLKPADTQALLVTAVLVKSRKQCDAIITKITLSRLMWLHTFCVTVVLLVIVI